MVTEAALEMRLVEVENRIQHKVATQVKEMVLGQLKEAGFDPELTAGALATLQTSKTTDNTQSASYAAAASRSHAVTIVKEKRTPKDRQEDKFWECRRSLRLWPVPNASEDNLGKYMKERLGLDDSFVADMGGESGSGEWLKGSRNTRMK